MINKDNWRSYLNLLIVYVIWGSTYMAIRVGVQAGSGFTPFSLGFYRVITSGIILLLIAKFRKNKFTTTRKEIILVLTSGFFLWTGGNGLLMVAEVNVNSGLAALFVGTLPLWMQIFESIIDKKMPTLNNFKFLMIGFVGIFFLVYPTIRDGGTSGITSMIALLIATISWGVGSLIIARNKINLPSRIISAYQMFAGGIGFYILMKIFQNPFPTPNKEAFFAWGYLVIFGGAIAYTSYVTVLRELPMKIVSTYAYVNPIIAVILGWLILGEEITISLFLGSIFIVFGVVGVFNEKYQN